MRKHDGPPFLANISFAGVAEWSHYLAFMSDRALTGYDHTDAASGEPDEELYLYDAQGRQALCARRAIQPVGVLLAFSTREDDRNCWSTVGEAWTSKETQSTQEILLD